MNQHDAVLAAKAYTENILTFFAVNVEVVAQLNGEYIEIAIPTTAENSLLIGRGAETLRSLQHLISSMLRNSDAAVFKVNLDIADYKKQRSDKLAEQAREWIEEVRSTGDTKVLQLNAADRRVVHGIAAEYSDIRTLSEGEGRDRRLTIAQVGS